MRDSLTLNTLLQTVKVDETKPTLLISEVVLTYMGRSSCNRVIQWILDFFQECILCTYEQVVDVSFFLLVLKINSMNT
jgi:O-methyltransferase involved in polyketide biosynthesis